MATKRNQVQVTIYMPPELAEEVDKLSELTRVPKAAYYREAVEDLLKKYAKELKVTGAKSKRSAE